MAIAVTSSNATAVLCHHRILVVEDDEIVRALLRELLSALSYEVVEANCATQALALLQTDTIDLILLDKELPDGDGIQLCRHARETLGLCIPIIMLTASTEPGDMSRSMLAGAVDFMRKPFVSDMLLARIRYALHIN
ncbi:MAG: response regulator transcription factor [Gammaproteobacteria bacterium]|nr:response regulator transcription factor [Gammaproteobacteria bacterium]